MVEIILGLGANKGDRAGYLRRAVTLLSKSLRDCVLSKVYESAALLPSDAPPEWNSPFLNMALNANCEIEPRALLALVKSIEAQLGRTPTAHWGPREIDIDILAYGREIIDEPALQIPHKSLLERDFALLPLADVAPGWFHPRTGKSASAHASAIPVQCRRTDIDLTGSIHD